MSLPPILLERRIRLPVRMKNVSRRPDDEADWGKLEALRYMIILELQGEVRRVAGQRRLESDDACANPHELYFALLSPAIVHCLPFDLQHGFQQDGFSGSFMKS